MYMESGKQNVSSENKSMRKYFFVATVHVVTSKRKLTRNPMP